MFGPSLDAFEVDPSGLSTDRLEEGFAQLQGLFEAVQARRLVWLGELERRRVWRRDGYVSGRAWLAGAFGVAGGAARRDLNVAEALRSMPVARRALQAGEVTASAVGLLAEARQEHREAFVGHEESLVARAAGTRSDELRRVVAEWSQARAAEEGPEGAERLRDRRHLSTVTTPVGMTAVRGELDPESGEVVATALRSIADADVRSSGSLDLRTSGQRLADALTELARRYLEAPDRPTVAGERPHLTVTIASEDLASGSGLGLMDHAGRLAPEAVRRLACDASVRRVVLAGRSVPLDVGRQTPVVSSGLRRAAAVRDRGCAFPTCDWPAAWTDAHHVRHWADGGETKLTNLVLLCRHHHGLVHEGGFSVVMRDGGPAFHRPDGSVLEDGRGPP